LILPDGPGLQVRGRQVRWEWGLQKRSILSSMLHCTTRPVGIEFAGALYPVTSRGDRREAINEDDADRGRFLEVLSEVIATFNWACHAYCLSNLLVVAGQDHCPQIWGVATPWPDFPVPAPLLQGIASPGILVRS